MLLMLCKGLKAHTSNLQDQGEKTHTSVDHPNPDKHQGGEASSSHTQVCAQTRWKDPCAEPEAFFLAYMGYKGPRNARGLLATSITPNTSHCWGVEALHIPTLPPPSLLACRHPKGDHSLWHKL